MVYSTGCYVQDQKWWSPEQEKAIIFGKLGALNKDRFREFFSCGDKQRPLFLHLETVNICNLRCIICPYISMTRPKETMTMSLFERIIDGYVTMGGGDVALTPSVGDVFLDKNLVDRFRLLRTRPNIKSIGFVTNVVNAGAFSDEEISYIVNQCTRINISIYGLDEEEHVAMTRRPGKYEIILEQIKRIISINKKASIVFVFRLLKTNAEERALSWMNLNFGKVIDHDIMTRFGNWGGGH